MTTGRACLPMDPSPCCPAALCIIHGPTFKRVGGKINARRGLYGRLYLAGPSRYPLLSGSTMRRLGSPLHVFDLHNVYL